MRGKEEQIFQILRLIALRADEQYYSHSESSPLAQQSHSDMDHPVCDAPWNVTHPHCTAWSVLLWCPSWEQGGISLRVLGVSAMGAEVCSWFSVIWGFLGSSLVPLHLNPLCYAAAKTQLSWKIVKSTQSKQLQTYKSWNPW